MRRMSLSSGFVGIAGLESFQPRPYFAAAPSTLMHVA
jgi:hypothetical protein